MTSKAAKLRAKRIARLGGRPRKEDVDRYPSGKIKPSETEKETLSVGIAARKTHHGDKCASRDANAGYVIGRLYLDGRITETQKSAADEYAEAMARYYSLVGIPFPSPRAQVLFSIKGHDGEISSQMADRARRATNRMMELEGILLRCKDGPQVKTTVFNACIMDNEALRFMPDRQLMWLQTGLDEIHRHKTQGL